MKTTINEPIDEMCQWCFSFLFARLFSSAHRQPNRFLFYAVRCEPLIFVLHRIDSFMYTEKCHVMKIVTALKLRNVEREKQKRQSK